jgi:hypothetical protein
MSQLFKHTVRVASSEIGAVFPANTVTETGATLDLGANSKGMLDYTSKKCASANSPSY